MRKADIAVSALHPEMDTIFPIKASDVNSQISHLSLPDGVEIIRMFLYFAIADELLDENRMEICE